MDQATVSRLDGANARIRLWTLVRETFIFLRSGQCGEGKINQFKDEEQ